MTTKTVAEIVTFRLKPGIAPDHFTSAAQAMTPFLHRTGDMISRVLSQDDDGLWTDHILWTSQQAAKAAATEVMRQPEAAPFMEMIDTANLSMRHAGVALNLPPE